MTTKTACCFRFPNRGLMTTKTACCFRFLDLRTHKYGHEFRCSTGSFGNTLSDFGLVELKKNHLSAHFLFRFVGL